MVQQNQNKNTLKTLKLTLERVIFNPTFHLLQAAHHSLQRPPVPSFDTPHHSKAEAWRCPALNEACPQPQAKVIFQQ